MNPVDALALNDRAEALYREGLPSQALSLFQQVFLEGARQNDETVRVQVARALYFAARCNRELGQAERAAQIEQSLRKRFGSDTNPRARSWAQRLDEKDEAPSAAPNPELDQFLDDLFAGKNSPAKQGEAPHAESKDFSFQTDEPEPEQDSEQEPARRLDPVLRSNEPLRSSSGDVPTWFAEEDVTLALLQRVFDAAFMEARLDEDGDLRVVVDETRVYLQLREELKLVRIFAAWGVKDHATFEQRSALAERINDDFVLVRAAFPSDTTLLLDCALPFAGGLFARQMVHLTRLFHSVAMRALQSSDEDDIIG